MNKMENQKYTGGIVTDASKGYSNADKPIREEPLISRFTQRLAEYNKRNYEIIQMINGHIDRLMPRSPETVGDKLKGANPQGQLGELEQQIMNTEDTTVMLVYINERLSGI